MEQSYSINILTKTQFVLKVCSCFLALFAVQLNRKTANKKSLLQHPSSLDPLVFFKSQMVQTGAFFRNLQTVNDTCRNLCSCVSTDWSPDYRCSCLASEQRTKFEFHCLVPTALEREQQGRQILTDFPLNAPRF